MSKMTLAHSGDVAVKEAIEVASLSVILAEHPETIVAQSQSLSAKDAEFTRRAMIATASFNARNLAKSLSPGKFAISIRACGMPPLRFTSHGFQNLNRTVTGLRFKHASGILPD